MTKITVEQLLMGRVTLASLPQVVQANLKALVYRVNSLYSLGMPVTKINDGYRRPRDTPANGSKTSMHLHGAAIDLDDDEKGTLWEWVKDHLAALKSQGLWVEDPRWTHGPIGTWVHLQCYPPRSGKRVFIPSSALASAPEIWDGSYPTSLDK